MDVGRVYATTHQRPIDRFRGERNHLSATGNYPRRLRHCPGVQREAQRLVGEMRLPVARGVGMSTGRPYRCTHLALGAEHQRRTRCRLRPRQR